MKFLTTLLATAAFCSAENLENADASALVLEDQAVLSPVNGTSNGWTMYKQCDSRWANDKLGTCSQTVCSAGCAMSSVAMILATKGANKDPGSLNSWLKNHGGYASGCNIVWGSVDALGYTTFVGKQNPTYSEMCNGLDAGHGLVANVHNGGHWVLLTKCKGNNIFEVNDPGYSTTTYSRSEIVDLAVYH